MVPTTVPGIVDLIDWYRERIRPLYKSLEGFEDSVFVSEHGTRVSASTVDSRLAEHLQRAGFKKGVYSPHSLRRSMVTHELMRGDAEFSREKARHKDAKTTTIYGKVPQEHVMRRARSLVRRQLQDATAESDK
ncbi:MAG: tyrosine-type recombinase/integrase [Rhodanobacteraceae bacterium]|nr:tyrosine-type recombinase/integrase [Rhodanobacteraceae bacterium]